MASAFAYKPLEDASRNIRLLRVESLKPLTCYTSVHGFESAPAFRAISYTWGEARKLTDIILDGQPFKVRPNSIYALQQAYQHFTVGTLLWIDTICINQDDNDEKSAQVARMGEIYREAVSVFVSVGPAYGNSDFLYEMARDLEANTTHEPIERWLDRMAQDAGSLTPQEPDVVGCQRCSIVNGGRFVAPARGEEVSGRAVELHMHHAWGDTLDERGFSKLKSAYMSFISRPYWQRVWIIQETALAQHVEVACGEAVSDLHHLSPLSRLFQNGVHEYHHLTVDRRPTPLRHDYRVDRPDYFSFVAGRCPDPARALGLSGLGAYSIHVFRRELDKLQCSDVRDRVYGLLELLHWPRFGPPKPDYTTHPFDLALQVIARNGRPNDSTPHMFTFPEHVSEILKGLEIAVDFDVQPGGESGLESLPISWSARAQTSIAQHGRDSFCYCEPCLKPDIGLLSYTDWSRVIPQGDDLLFKLTPHRLAPHETSLCLRLRRLHGFYYEIVNELAEASSEDAWSSRPEEPKIETLWLCLDLEDAAFMVLAHQERLARTSLGQEPGDGETTTIGKRLCRKRASSFAIRMPWAAPEHQYPYVPDEVEGVPVPDDRWSICARCGGITGPYY